MEMNQKLNGLKQQHAIEIQQQQQQHAINLKTATEKTIEVQATLNACQNKVASLQSEKQTNDCLICSLNKKHIDDAAALDQKDKAISNLKKKVENVRNQLMQLQEEKGTYRVRSLRYRSPQLIS